MSSARSWRTIPYASLLELLDKSERRALEAWLGAYRNAAEIERARSVD
ncbi:hypothetical protein [Paraburkholderia tuberum]|nr:hypothetical protein [Paraburkholderia tuberum]